MYGPSAFTGLVQGAQQVVNVVRPPGHMTPAASTVATSNARIGPVASDPEEAFCTLSHSYRDFYGFPEFTSG